MKDKIRQRLKDLGLSARKASLKVGPNADLIRSVLRDRTQDPRGETLRRIATALEVSPEWLLGDAADAPPPPMLRQDLTGSLWGDGGMPRDVPVYGTAAGALATSFEFSGGIVDRVARPPGLAGAPDAYALYVTGTSMEPEHRHGDLRFVHPHRPVRPGDTVILQIHHGDRTKLQLYIKHLERQGDDKIVTTQLNPYAEISWKRAYVEAVHKVLTIGELFGV